MRLCVKLLLLLLMLTIIVMNNYYNNLSEAEFQVKGVLVTKIPRCITVKCLVVLQPEGATGVAGGLWIFPTKVHGPAEHVPAGRTLRLSKVSP